MQHYRNTNYTISPVVYLEPRPNLLLLSRYKKYAANKKSEIFDTSSIFYMLIFDQKLVINLGFASFIINKDYPRKGSNLHNFR
jgi:hypothetical protein